MNITFKDIKITAENVLDICPGKGFKMLPNILLEQILNILDAAILNEQKKKAKLAINMVTMAADKAILDAKMAMLGPISSGIGSIQDNIPGEVTKVCPIVNDVFSLVGNSLSSYIGYATNIVEETIRLSSAMALSTVDMRLIDENIRMLSEYKNVINLVISQKNE